MRLRLPLQVCNDRVLFAEPFVLFGDALAGREQCKHENFGVFIGQPSGLRLGQRAA